MYIIVAGAGILGRGTARQLIADRHDVVVVDRDRAVCETVHAEIGAMAVHGSATDIRILAEAGAGKAAVIVCTLHNDADNIACALLARSLGIPRVVARLRDPGYEEAYRAAGIASIVRMADLMLNMIVTEVEQPKVRKVWIMGRNKAGIYAVKIPPQARSAGRTIREIAGDHRFPRDCIVVCAYHPDADEYQVSRGDYVIRGGDMIFFAAGEQDLRAVTDILTRT
ncbi:MAG TPA: TrkA family potassium uptake protein [bacterium]|nr:TrkA family potassium uptake protein [bacterium]HPJ71316.1 TrkA family potassium uptake protein [bacterium]HPQ66955.1 TrkA family potassium uptake protein [bacterium]